MKQNDIFFSIVIPALNEEKPLTRLLDCLKTQSYTNFEIIVADAGSTDKTREVAESRGALIVEGGLPGVGRNSGAARASGRFLLFLDADVEIDNNFLENSKREIEEFNIKIAGCEAVPLSDLAIDRVIHKLAFIMMKITKETNPRLPGYCIVINRELFNQVGGFDEKVQLAEDYDLVRRVTEFAPLHLLETVVVHVSMRRFDKEGRLPYIGKAVKVFFHRKIRGEIRDDSIEYEFDNFDSGDDPVFNKSLGKIEKKLDKLEKKVKRASDGTKSIPDRFVRSIHKLKKKMEKLLQ